MNYKNLSKLVIPIVLVCAVAASLWFASPTLVKALTIDITPPADGTLGSTHSFTVKIDIADDELVPIQSIDMEIYNVDDPSEKITCTGLPLNDGGTKICGTITITDTTTSNWEWFSGTGYAYWKGTGYYFSPPPTFGYGYQTTGTASIEYAGTWTSPSGWPAGTYKIKVSIRAESDKPLEVTFTQTSSEFTLSAMAGAGAPAAPPSITDTKGIVKKDTTTASSDGICGLSIDKGTKALTKAGKALSKVTVAKMAEPPAPPTGSNIIGLTYDLGPDGATFDPPITLTLTYDPDEIPAGVDEEDLVIAMWDEDAGEWVELAGCIIDPVTHTITAPVSHFTAFTILGAAAPPIDEEYQAALAALAEAEAAKVQAEADLAAAQAQVTSLQDEVDAAQAQVESLQDDIDTAQVQAASLQSDLDAAQTRLTAAQEQLAELEVPAGIAWWVWLIVGLAAVTVIGAIVWFVRRRIA